MQQKFFVKSFAEAGDREAVPNDIQTTGDVSYEQGYGYDYQRDQAIDPLAKPIERNKHNAILHDITEAVQQYQVFGTPEWITAQDNDGVPYPYARRARVRYRASETAPWDVYESLVDNNTTEPNDATKWASVVSAIASQEQAVAGTDNSTIMTPLRVAQAIAASLNNIGQIVFEPRTSARVGYLKCNGAVLKRADYPALWAYAQASGTLVSDADWLNNRWGCFSSGDGSVTFRIPELRGEFLRCWDDGRGVDNGRGVGTLQDNQNRWHDHDAFAAEVDDHVHNAWTDAQGWHTHGGSTTAAGGHNHISDQGTNLVISGHNGPSAGIGPGANYHLGNSNWVGDHAHGIHGDGNHGHVVGIGNAGAHTHTITINGDGENEARPRNIAILAMIRAY